MNVIMFNYMFKKPESRLSFIVKSALTFRLSLDSVAKVFKVDKNEFYEKLSTHHIYGHSMKYLFIYGFDPNQEEAVNNFEEYFKRLKDAYVSENKELTQQTLGELDDKEANFLKANLKLGQSKTDHEVLIILKYQLKYGYDIASTCRAFNTSRDSYVNRVRALEPDFPDLVRRFREIDENVRLLNLNNYEIRENNFKKR